MLLFQFPGVAEEALRRDDWRLARELLGGDGDLERYVADLSRPGALTAALNWYRAQRPSTATAVGDITVPTLYIWSDRDPALGRAAARATGRYVKGEYRFEVMHGVNHWIPETRPDALSQLLIEHLAEDRPVRLQQSRAR